MVITLSTLARIPLLTIRCRRYVVRESAGHGQWLMSNADNGALFALRTCWPWLGSPSMPGIGAVASVTAAMKLAPDSIACAVCGSCAAGPCAKTGLGWFLD